MQTDSSPQLFLVSVGLVCLGAVGTYTVRAIQDAMQRSREDRATQALCYSTAKDILVDAKHSPPEVGTYEATLDVTDSWDQSLTSVLVVGELSNSVSVKSIGRDSISGTKDDHRFSKTDVHVRKSILKGIGSGVHAAGKGVTTGVAEGVGTVGSAAWKKAKAGVSRVKSSLLSKFKRKEKSDEDG